jgi:CheY-like chemotaxis protein
MTDDEIARIRHDLRASVNTIVAWAELLRRGPCDEVSRVRAGETIARHARRLSERINVALELWTLETHGPSARLEPVRLPGLLHAAMSGARAERAQPPQWQVAFDSEERYVSADPQHLRQAMTTLLTHAATNAPDGGAVEVALHRDPDGSGLVLTVRDGGPPVEAQLLALVQQQPASDQSAEHTRPFDLGLLLVRDLVMVNHGQFEIQQNGDGASPTFRVVLPGLIADQVEPAQPEPLPSDTEKCESLQGVRVLVVDDEPDAREALEGLLRFHGAVVSSAASVRQAMAALDGQAVDVLLADIAMPGLDGFDLIAAVRTHTRQDVARLPAAAVTAFATTEDRRRARAAGFQQHLAKPVEPDRLLAAVLTLIRGPQAS